MLINFIFDKEQQVIALINEISAKIFVTYKFECDNYKMAG